MAIECKVSNSTVNSYKRLVHDTGGKAAHWYNQLGRAQVIPCAVLSGVYGTANLADVQENKGVYLAAPFGRPRRLRQKGEIAQGDLATRTEHISGLTRSPRQDQDVRAGTSFAGTGTDQVRRSKERSRGCRHI
jgi:hypothetical protein